MASVTLDRVHLSLADDLTSSVAAFSSGRSEVLSVPGSVRRMANGRLRVVSRAGSSSEIGATLRNLSPTQVALLRSWVGRTVLFRDVWGRKVWGAFFSVNVTDYKDRLAQDVELSISEVTYSEAV